MSPSSNLPASINRFGSLSLDRVTRTIERETSQQMARTVGQGLVANTREEIRAAITSTALQNVGALSALEQHLIEVAPMGAARYQHIVDAYTVGAAQTIARW
jgi:hypothetical protein